jgi:hypothetical protein
MVKAMRSIGFCHASKAYKVLDELENRQHLVRFIASRPEVTMRALTPILVCLASRLSAVAAASLTDVCTVGYCTLNGGWVHRFQAIS